MESRSLAMRAVRALRENWRKASVLSFSVRISSSSASPACPTSISSSTSAALNLFQHILTYDEIDVCHPSHSLSSDDFSLLSVRGCEQPLIWTHKLALRSVISWIVIFSASTMNYSHSRILPSYLVCYSVHSRSN